MIMCLSTGRRSIEVEVCPCVAPGPATSVCLKVKSNVCECGWKMQSLCVFMKGDWLRNKMKVK